MLQTFLQVFRQIKELKLCFYLKLQQKFEVQAGHLEIHVNTYIMYV